MKGHYEIINGKKVDIPSCRTCKHKSKMTVESPCYNCIDSMSLALHLPNAETEFACYEASGEP